MVLQKRPTISLNLGHHRFTTEANAKQRRALLKLIGHPVSKDAASFEAIKLVSSSLADLCILPIQDVLGLGPQTRMNNPSHLKDNWQWRVTKKQLTNMRIDELHDITVTVNRA